MGKSIPLPQEAQKRSLQITSEIPSDYYTKLSFSNASSSLEVIQKAQMEQVQRRRYLNSLASQQQNSMLCSMNTLNYATPYIPREDTDTLDFPRLLVLPNSNEQQQSKIGKNISPAMLPNNVSVAVLPNMPSFS